MGHKFLSSRLLVHELSVSGHAAFSTRRQLERRFISTSEVKRPDVTTPDGLVESPVVLRRAQKQASSTSSKVVERSKEWDTDSSLIRNPWAIALASPPRLCHATMSRLPTELMIDFGLVQHPETSALWLLPTSLLETELNEMEIDPNAKVTAGDNDASAVSEILMDDSTAKMRKRRTAFPSVRVTNSGTILDMLSNPKFSNISKGLIPPSWKLPQGPLTKSSMQTLVWRGDMSDYALKAMRKDILRCLKKILRVTPKIEKQRRRDTWTPLNIAGHPITQSTLESSLKQLPELRDIRSGMVLILRGNHHSTEINSNPDCNASSTAPENPSFDLAELPVHESQVPVFDLTKMLSEGELQEIRQLGEVFQGDALYFIPASRKSALFALDLWRLKSFLMERNEKESSFPR
ncbi:hypothetical protein H112_00255 [Trichophyton rubrum D6]|nr:hypothetical protein H100_00257 [Trichophyton rubrum MR850]EZF46893.1 hypothetical protein H102_00255 [Trichophyton rubrum CBS 100081]EZF57541.1 hypothetical protein H103_00255 [Trichophyton rubrum CBS 288.86]EZF68143.1 hypothetical protein H104_00255 [Trichophyton rubrum CBS 289.86]EZF78802.1 hypothetical protein H105_00248 [Trichophyton soudanense CBS 452.61]EZG00220.1 hypothetical protein H113_00257 [Trichophyton rubrum MR1459]EZG11121.1 hypothetical protein H106_00147 [Trichophyton rub